LGTKPKFWYSDGGRRVLFKAEERGTGEDWAEKVACALCDEIGLPHVHYELAEEWDGDSYIRPGVICETCVPPGGTLALGNELLLALDPEYPAEHSAKYRVRAHTIQAVAEALEALEPPTEPWMAGVPSGIVTALDVFVGYVLLDAWIANQDRHHENWGAIRQEEFWLAPTFDHGASLARNLTDEERKDRLTTRDQNRSVSHFAGRARSAFFAQSTDAKPIGTVEAFSAFARGAPVAARLWLDKMVGVERSVIEGVLREVPNQRMSKITKDFTLRLLVLNQDRLRQEAAEL
jgi:hypothetical protein